MPTPKKQKTSNQELRTRKDILLAANRLLKQGIKPTMEEVAEEAMVSRATAYRYFGSIDTLLVEVPIDAAMLDPADKAEAYMHEVVFQNETLLRVMLANSIARSKDDNTIPTRQNRRMPLIEAALSPSRHRFADDDYESLKVSLAMIFGPESMIALCDVINLDKNSARKAKSWAVCALVRAALDPLKTETDTNTSNRAK